MVWKQLAALLVPGLVFVTACSGSSESALSDSDSDTIPSECPQPEGAYEATWEKRSGTCPEVGTKVIFADEPDEGCTFSYNRGTVEADGCKLEQAATCESGGTSRKVNLVLHVPNDMQNLTGTYSISVSGGCSGTYDVTYVKR